MFIPCMIGSNFLSTFGASHMTVLENHQYYRLITAMFCHAGIAHILCNMISLKSVGSLIESIYGEKKMMAIFFITGIVATITSIISQPAITTVGVSGAICGLIGAFLAVMQKSGNMTPEVLMQALFPIALLFFIPNIDSIAHVAGLVCGYVVGKLFFDSRDRW